jgi:hypothetical protein
VQLLARVDEVGVLDDVLVQLEQLLPAALDLLVRRDRAEGLALDDLVLAVALLDLLAGRGGDGLLGGRALVSRDSVLCCEELPESFEEEPPPLAFDRPLPQTGQAPLPWPARTFSPISICCSLVAWSAVEAYLVPP